MEMALSNKVSDIVKRSVCCSKSDVYVTSGGRELRRSEELRSCGVSEGSTVEVTSRMRVGGKHKDKKNQAEKNRNESSVKLEQTLGEKTEVEPELTEDSQEVRVDDGMCALVCEQMRAITAREGEPQVTSEEMQRVVEQVKSMRMTMADVRKHATNEDLQRMEKMEEGWKKFEEEARTRQAEMRAKGTEEQDATMRSDEEVGRKAKRERERRQGPRGMEEKENMQAEEEISG